MLHEHRGHVTANDDSNEKNHKYNTTCIENS